MKITREMVLAMGGDDSQQYYQFRSLCCECFSLLRRRSNLVITLFRCVRVHVHVRVYCMLTNA